MERVGSRAIHWDEAPEFESSLEGQIASFGSESVPGETDSSSFNPTPRSQLNTPTSPDHWASCTFGSAGKSVPASVPGYRELTDSELALIREPGKEIMQSLIDYFNDPNKSEKSSEITQYIKDTFGRESVSGVPKIGPERDAYYEKSEAMLKHIFYNAKQNEAKGSEEALGRNSLAFMLLAEACNQCGPGRIERLNQAYLAANSDPSSASEVSVDDREISEIKRELYHIRLKVFDELTSHFDPRGSADVHVRNLYRSQFGAKCGMADSGSFLEEGATVPEHVQQKFVAEFDKRYLEEIKNSQMLRHHLLSLLPRLVPPFEKKDQIVALEQKQNSHPGLNANERNDHGKFKKDQSITRTLARKSEQQTNRFQQAKLAQRYLSQLNDRAIRGGLTDTEFKTLIALKDEESAHQEAFYEKLLDPATSELNELGYQAMLKNLNILE